MSLLTKIGRWIACVPAGVLSGFVAAVLSLLLLSPLLGHLSLIDLGGWALAGLVQPLVGFHTGRAVAPSRGRISREVVLMPYVLLGSLSALTVFHLLWNSGPDAPGEWWEELGFFAGSAVGCLALLLPPTPRSTGQHDEGARPFESSFEWTASLR